MKFILSTALMLFIIIVSCKKQETQRNDDVTVEGLDEDQNISISENAYNAKTFSRAVSPETVFTYDGKTVKVKAYSRNVGDTKNSPVFQYGDLINRAIAYKSAHPSTTVKIKFAIYAISDFAYIGFNPSHSSYGYVKGNDHGGAHSERLIWSIVKAAKNEVYIDFIYHKDVSGNTHHVYQYIFDLLEDKCYTDTTKKVKDYLRIRQIGWGDLSGQQMHAKFMTVSHYAGDGGAAMLNTTYCTSANIDKHGSNGIPTSVDWVQSGILINGHPELMASYNQYFDLIYNNYSNQANFKTAVRAAHSTNSLNYDDYHFSSYFTPIPTTKSNAWDTSFNPVAKYVSRMASAPDKYMKVNAYYLGADFGKTLYDSLYAIYHAPGTGIRDFKFVVAHTHSGSDFPLSNYNNIGTIRYPKHTHSKDVLFAFGKFYTITGSTNLTVGEYTTKANTSVVVKEYTSAHPVYISFRNIYSYQY